MYLIEGHASAIEMKDVHTFAGFVNAHIVVRCFRHSFRFERANN